MRQPRLLVCFLLCVLGIAIGAWLRDWVRIDVCLDRGGAWNDEQGICIGSGPGFGKLPPE